jgi:tRNA uridine 5-carbamoylmethylation protein Kti12
MPLVIICGRPGSGKSEVCERLQELLKDKKHVVVRDNGMSDYKDAEKEKMSRGELFSAVERELCKEVRGKLVWFGVFHLFFVFS